MALGGVTRETNEFQKLVQQEPEVEKQKVKQEPHEKPNAAIEKPEGNEPSNETEDLISQIAQFEEENNPTNLSDDEIDEKMFSDKELRDRIESIREKDPELADMLELQRKSMIRGVNGKFQEIAEMRKQLQSQNTQGSDEKPARFVANSVEELLKNPEFVQEAQSYQGEDEDDPAVQAKKIAQQQIDQYKQEQMAKQQQEQWNQWHDQLSRKYGKSYNRQEIDQTAAQLAQGKIQATPEYIYKVMNYERDLERARQIGIRQGSKVAQQKTEINTPSGINTVEPFEIKQDEKESNQDFFRRISKGFFSGQIK